MIVKLHSSKTRGRGKVTETRASALVGHIKFKEAGCHLFSVHLSELPAHIKIILHTFCAFTIEFTAHQLHTQRACPATNHGDDADVLGHDGRVKQVGLCAVVIRVPHKNLQHAKTQGMRRWRQRCILWWYTVGATSHLVPPLAVQPVSSVWVSVKAACHLEGLDVLSCAHAAGALRDDARQTHLLLHVNLFTVTRCLLDPFTTLLLQPHGF